jgi:hypothetical protein
MIFNFIGKPFRNAARLACGSLFALALASCGGGGGSAGTNPSTPTGTTKTTGSISLLFSSPQLPSAGVAGTEVTITALVKDTNNNALSAIPVQFTADSGALVVTNATSDLNGQAKATLSTAGDRTDRTINIVVTAGGKSATGSVSVVGTTISSVGPSSISSGSAGDFLVTVKDSAGAAVANAAVSFASQLNNKIVVKTSGGGTATAPLTNAQGQITLTLTGATSGTDTLTLTALGTSATSTLTINAQNLSISTPTTAVFTGSSCTPITASYMNNGVPQTGSMTFSTSRGTIYSDSVCTVPLGAASVQIVAGSAQSYIKASTVGIATITAIAANGPSTQTQLEFDAALLPSSTISLQPNPAVIGTNSGVGVTQKSVITAIVRDGSANNNLVKNTVVAFTIVNDSSGGSLLNPSVVTTDSNGVATVTFIAGANSTPTNGVTIQATIQSTVTSASATTTLTVARTSLSIQAGTGNTIVVPNDTQYQQNWSVFVTDASGNPVSNATITASLWAPVYRKGTLVAGGTFWVLPANPITCVNEDTNQNGILDPGEDTNSNGRLDPGIPFNVSVGGTTDATGTAVIAILYPKDHALWLDVQMTIRGSVSGSEATFVTPVFMLEGVATDYALTTTPPGFHSPYGVNPCNVAN